MKEQKEEPLRVKSWGTSKLIYKDDYVILTYNMMNPTTSTTIHKHFKKNEMIKNITPQTDLIIMKNNDNIFLKYNDNIIIEPNATHRIHNFNNHEINYLQIQFGDNLKEEDKVIIDER
jgi:hypothetical protein